MYYSAFSLFSIPANANNAVKCSRDPSLHSHTDRLPLITIVTEHRVITKCAYLLRNECPWFVQTWACHKLDPPTRTRLQNVFLKLSFILSARFVSSVKWPPWVLLSTAWKKYIISFCFRTVSSSPVPVVKSRWQSEDKTCRSTISNNKTDTCIAFAGRGFRIRNEFQIAKKVS